MCGLWRTRTRAKARDFKARRPSPAGVVVAALVPLVLTACGGSPTAYERARANYYDSRGEYLEDAALTSKVAAAILDEPRLRDSTIRVVTYGNIVQLTGAVDSVRDAYIAEDIAASVIGVRRVDNDLVVN